MFDKVTITYRGAKYEIGRGRDFYGVWPVGASRSEPLDRWPETPEGWSAAWTRFTSIEAPGAIVPVGRRTPALTQPAAPAGQAAEPAGQGSGPAGLATGTAGLATEAAGQGTETAGQGTETAGLAAGAAEPAGPGAAAASAGVPYAPGPAYGQGYGADASSRRPPLVSGRLGAIMAAGLLGLGVVLGVAGLFPDYLGGSALTQQAGELVPHVIYLAAWTAGAALILLGGARRRLGALLAVGLSAVTFGLFFADAGTAVASSGGAGLVLSLLGWVACAAGSVIALLLVPAEQPGRTASDGAAYGAGGARRRGFLRLPRGSHLGPAILLVLAGLGVAVAFAPSWDSYTLRTASGQAQSFTAGNAFDNPGLVITGDVLVMVALAAIVILAVLWHPVRHGAVLLGGAAVAMVAQAISALAQLGVATSPAQFGITSSEASQLGLTISNGVTPAFWIYCGFLVALVVSCAWMLASPDDGVGTAAVRPAGPDVYGWNSAAPGHHDNDAAGLTVGYGTVPSRTGAGPREDDDPAS